MAATITTTNSRLTPAERVTERGLITHVDRPSRRPCQRHRMTRQRNHLITAAHELSDERPPHESPTPTTATRIPSTMPQTPGRSSPPRALPGTRRSTVSSRGRDRPAARASRTYGGVPSLRARTWTDRDVGGRRPGCGGAGVVAAPGCASAFDTSVTVTDQDERAGAVNRVPVGVASLVALANGADGDS
jgi:hypothetical protein